MKIASKAPEVVSMTMQQKKDYLSLAVACMEEEIDHTYYSFVPSVATLPQLHVSPPLSLNSIISSLDVPALVTNDYFDHNSLAESKFADYILLLAHLYELLGNTFREEKE